MGGVSGPTRRRQRLPRRAGRYIRNEREQHRQVSYQDEFRAFLRGDEIPYDER
jgi:hypothetical protein